MPPTYWKLFPIFISKVNYLKWRGGGVDARVASDVQVLPRHLVTPSGVTYLSNQLCWVCYESVSCTEWWVAPWSKTFLVPIILLFGNSQTWMTLYYFLSPHYQKWNIFAIKYAFQYLPLLKSKCTVQSLFSTNITDVPMSECLFYKPQHWSWIKDHSRSTIFLVQ